MGQQVLFTASTYSHILHFHRPYLRRFREEGWVVHVACGGAPASIPEADEVIHLPLEKKMTAPANWAAARMLRRKIRAERYALIATHTSLAAFFTRMAVKGMRERPKVINMVHGYLFDDDMAPVKRTILRTAEQLTAGETDLLLTMNRADLNLAHRYHLGKEIGSVPGVGVDFSRLDGTSREQGLALRAQYGLKEEDFVLVYAAEFSQRKSQAVLIRAMAELPERVHLILPGEGALLEECRTLAAELGVGERVLFPGYCTHMAPWYAAADAAAAASRIEGLPFHVMEAMYLGLPVVASAVKGHVDLIEEGQNGLLYPYGDSKAFARQVRRLLEEPGLRDGMAARTRASVLQYGLEQVLPQVWDCYTALFQESREKYPVR